MQGMQCRSCSISLKVHDQPVTGLTLLLKCICECCNTADAAQLMQHRTALVLWLPAWLLPVKNMSRHAPIIMRCRPDSTSQTRYDWRMNHCLLTLQLAGVIIGIVGFGIALTLEIPDGTTRDHRGIGIAVFSLGIFQVLMGFFRIHKGSRWRMHWAWVSRGTSP